MQKPERTGDPDHMEKYVQTSDDSGGVHSNSNIHNKAAYNLMTSKDTESKFHFTPRDAAILYYLCLSRLNKLATFQQARDTLLNVAGVYYAGHADRQQRIAAIREAYAGIGL
jgi:Zn-dependent metalloprotease